MALIFPLSPMCWDHRSEVQIVFAEVGTPNPIRQALYQLCPSHMEFLPEPSVPHPVPSWVRVTSSPLPIDGLCTSLVSRTGPSVESAPVIDCLLNTCITGIGRGSGSSVIWQRGVSGQEEGVTEGWGLTEEAEFCSALFHDHP